MNEDQKFSAQTVAVFLGAQALVVLLIAAFAVDLRWTYVPPCVAAVAFMLVLYDFRELLKGLWVLLAVQLFATYIYITPPTAPPQADCAQAEAGQ